MQQNIHFFQIKKLLLTTVCLSLCITISFAQDDIIVTSNNGTNDINFTDCASITNLSFSSFLDYSWVGTSDYIWILYRDNVEIDRITNAKVICKLQQFTNGNCLEPVVTFTNISPIQGSYKLQLKVEGFLGFLLIFIPIGDRYNRFSNEIYVTRFDNGFECTCDMPFNINVNCFTMNNVHNFGLSFTARARNNVDVGCIIPSGKTSTFIAENKVTSISGFHARAGSNVHVYIDDCPGINKTSGNESLPDTIGVIDMINTILDTSEVNPSLDLSDDDNEEQGNHTIDDVKQVKIYPNPTTGKFVVEITETHIVSNSTIFIYNVLGEIIYKKNVSTPIVTIDLSSNSKGIYYLHMVNENNIFRGKIIYQ